MKDLKIYLASATFLLIVYITIEYNKPQPQNWEPTLYYGDKIPFGTYILHRQLTDIFPGATVTNTNRSIYEEFHDAKPLPGNYLIIAKSVGMSKLDFNEMLKYIKAGNNVFISTLQWTGHIADTLSIETSTNYLKKSPGLNFTNEQLKRDSDYLFDKGISTLYFSKFDTTKATVIGKNSAGYSNLLSFKFGKGNLYVCANPEVFTNYNLLKPTGADYAAKIFSYLSPKQNIYWDQHQNHDIADEESPMRVFFSYASLQWAYYISLFSLVLFIVYDIKRRQRVIPIINPLKNATLDFVTVVGQVYYEKRDNANIAAKKILYLLGYLRDQYQLKTNKLDSEFVTAMAQKTGIDISFARELVNHINYLAVQQRVTDNELITLNQLIEKFHTQS